MRYDSTSNLFFHLDRVQAECNQLLNRHGSDATNKALQILALQSAEYKKVYWREVIYNLTVHKDRGRKS